MPTHLKARLLLVYLLKKIVKFVALAAPALRQVDQFPVRTAYAVHQFVRLGAGYWQFALVNGALRGMKRRSRAGRTALYASRACLLDLRRQAQ